MNRKMLSSLDTANPADFAYGQQLSESLSQLLAGGFSVIDGAVVFTSLRNIAENVRTATFPDLTGFECFVNQVHVEDQLASSTQLIKQAIAFAFAITDHLRSDLPEKAFRVIVAASTSGCGVRFHQVRPHEEWLASDLDGYGDEAILVVDT